MKGEYFIMNNASLRRIFSLLLAVMMVCALLPTAAFAEDIAEPQDGNGGVAAYANSSVPLTLNISSYSAPFYNPTKGTHDVGSFKFFKYINRSDVGSDNPKDCSATAHFVGSNETGWQLYVKLKIDNYEADLPQNAWIYNKDMSAATGTVTFGLSFNTAGGTSTYVHISGGKDLPTPPQPDKPTKPTAEDVKALLGNEVVKIFCGTAGSGVHPAAAYPLKDGSFTVGDVNSSGDIPTCDITVNAQPYVEDYNTKYTGHTLSTADHTPKVITLEYDSSTKTWSPKTPLPIIFNVVCDTAPSVPEQATKDDVLGANIKVTIVCDNTDVNHGSKDFDLTKDAITEISAPRQSSVGTYICDVTISSESYVPQFDQDKKATHTPPAATKKITLSYVDGKWIAPSIDTAYPHVNFTVRCGTKPAAPNHDELSKLIGSITINCTNDAATHDPKSKGYALIADSYTTSGVEGDAENGYTYTVTVRAAKFIEKYSSDMSDAVHTLIAGEPAEKTIELKWNGEKWVAETELPVTFHTLCPPEQPSKKDIEGAIGRGVKIVCDNQNVNHWGKDYKPTQGEYTVSDVTGTASEGYTCTITVKAAKIIEKYSSDMGKTHALIVGEQAEKTVELKWNGEKWVAKTELPITFHVECPPEKPTYDELKGLGINAKVDCTTTTAHNGKSYTLIEDTYNVSDPERKGTAYTCILTVNAKDYVAKYNAEENVGPHALDDRDSKTIELTWNGEKWTAAETSVTFNVKCELLTVTYTDGVKGEEVFADVVYKDIPYGTSTPAFGTKDPTREGYKFVGWEPEVTETVTENVTYTAKWEELYTVTYTDGVKGKAFKDQVYKDLESGTDTPKFDGKPTRKGYTFTGWSPKVTDTVTKDVTYVAQWKSVKNGKDNIPKTGDSEIVMVLGSVLLFSFCGAAAVSVYDRKRKHF